MNKRRLSFISTLLILAFGSSVLLLSGCGKKKKRRKKARATESTAAEATTPATELSCSKAQACLNDCGDRTKKLIMDSTSVGEVQAKLAVIAQTGAPPMNGPCLMKCLETHGFNGNLPTYYRRCPKPLPVPEAPAAPAAPVAEEAQTDEDNPEEAPAPVVVPDDAAEEDPPDLESDDSLVEPSALDAELVPDEDEPEAVMEATHQVVNTSGDLKAPWLALKAGPAPGDKYKMLAEMPDGTQLNVVEMGFGKRGQWWYVRVMSGTHKGTQGYAHSKWIRER